MHYRNGREARNGDKIIQLAGAQIIAFGTLHSAVPGNDYCNGYIASVYFPGDIACLCDCLHIDDVTGILTEKDLHKRPVGM